MSLRVSFLILHGREAPLGSQQVANISSGGPCKKSTEHTLTHLECRLHGMGLRPIIRLFIYTCTR